MPNYMSNNPMDMSNSLMEMSNNATDTQHIQQQTYACNDHCANIERAVSMAIHEATPAMSSTSTAGLVLLRAGMPLSSSQLWPMLPDGLKGAEEPFMTFHRFQKLPKEVQCMIWSFFFRFREKRVVKARFNLRRNAWSFKIPMPLLVPELMQLCSTSRYEALKVPEGISGNSHAMKPHIDWENDIIFITNTYTLLNPYTYAPHVELFANCTSIAAHPIVAKLLGTLIGYAQWPKPEWEDENPFCPKFRTLIVLEEEIDNPRGKGNTILTPIPGKAQTTALRKNVHGLPIHISTGFQASRISKRIIVGADENAGGKVKEISRKRDSNNKAEMAIQDRIQKPKSEAENKPQSAPNMTAKIQP